MGKKKEHHEEHVDETWLLPYSDMLTLLLALFIVMFAMSKVDQSKLKRMSEQFSIIFSGGSSVLTEDSGNSLISSMKNYNSSTASEGSGSSNKENEQNAMDKIKSSLEAEISKNGYSDKIKVNIDKEGLGISIQDVVLFNSGDAEVLSNIKPMLLTISKMLHSLDNNIRIAGYTDNVPITNEKFRSNWDLSAIRAVNVMNFMVTNGGISEQNVAIQAYGEYHPIASNSTEAGRAKNRRVEIFIVRKYQ